MNAAVAVPLDRVSIPSASAAATVTSRVVMALAATAAAVATVAWRFLTFAGFNNDHYVHLARAQQMLFGEWPVRDFVDPGLPLMYAVHAAARALFGPALGVEFGVVAAGFAIGAACTLIAATRLSGSIAVAMLVTTLEVAFSPRSFGYPKVLLYAVACLVIMSMARRMTARAIAAAAVVTVAAFLFRHDHGLFIGAASLTALLVGSAGDRQQQRRRVAVFLGVAAILVLPWALFVQSQQGLIEYFSSAVAFTRGEVVDHGLRQLPRFDLHALDTLSNALGWLFYTFHALPVIAIAVLVRRARQRPSRIDGQAADGWPGETAVIASLCVMAFLVNATFMRGSLDGRVADAIVPAALLGSWLAGLAFHHARDHVAAAAVAAIVLTITTGAVMRAGSVRDQLDRTELLRGPRIVRLRAADLWDRFQGGIRHRDDVPSRYSAALLPFTDYVKRCTSQQDRLLVTGLFPEIYVIAERGFAGGQMSFQPGFYTTAADQAQTIGRLRRQSVPFVISARKWYPDLKRQMPDLFEYLEQRYMPLFYQRVPETEGVDVWVERNRPAARTDAETGWPCFR